MDWQLSVIGPAITPVFWGLIRTPPEKRDRRRSTPARTKTTAAMKILDAQLGKTRFVAGDAFSYGDIPVGVMARRYRDLSPTGLHSPTSNAGTCGDRGTSALSGISPDAPMAKRFAGVAGDIGQLDENIYNASPRKSFGTSPDQPGGLADEPPLERRQALDQAEPDVAHQRAARRSDWRTAG